MMSNPKYSAIANQISDLFKRISDDMSKLSNRESTCRIIKEFTELGESEELGYAICPSKEYCNPEWLYDLIWFKNNKDDQECDMLREVGLVLECEWSVHYEDVRYDFEKLLLANAPIKVMIFQAEKFTYEDAFAKMEKSIQNYLGGNSAIYILACYSHPEFICEKVIYDAEHNKITVELIESLRQSEVFQNVTAVVSTAAAIQ